jgi:hypothetical protein
MQKCNYISYRACALLLEVIKYPDASPYALSMILHDKGIRMYPQTIYNIFDDFKIRDVKKRRKLREKFLKKFNAI